MFDVGKGADMPITGIEFRKVPHSNKYYVFVTTCNKLYLFVGCANYDDKPLLQSIFNTYLNKQETGGIDFASNLNYSIFDFFCDKKSLFPKAFGWLTEKGILYGEVRFPSVFA